MDLIDRLRQKPLAVRKRIAIATSAVVTLAIFGLWLTVFHFDLNTQPSNQSAAVANSTASGSASDINPFSAFLSVMSKGWDGLVKNIDQIKTGAGQVQDLVNTAGSVAGATSSEQTPQPNSPNDVLILDKTTP